ncbi:MAG: autotransporter outer membrane beta-barrel domain-containing protein, partial [Desulfovibrionaceae bacterium]|nr:autotransporter outer membrane beta-barrel domain-containing protein [Desulfovibrionaceae bacterium]
MQNKIKNLNSRNSKPFGAEIFFLIIYFSLLFPLNTAQAFNSLYSVTSKGIKFIELEFADKGEKFEEEEKKAFRTLSKSEKNDIARAGDLWANIFSPFNKNKSPVYFRVTPTNDKDNASCGCDYNDPKKVFAMASSQEAIIFGKKQKRTGGIEAGIFKSSKNNLLYSHLSNDTDYVGIYFHELGHGFGIDSRETDDLNKKNSKYIITKLNVYDQHLFDKYGTQYAIGLKLVDKDPGKATPGVFYVGPKTSSGVRFKGEHLAQVMGNNDGVIIEGTEGKRDGKTVYDLSHIEFEHSLMSHQDYRNYNTFLEPEFAMLEDLGYKIDRKNFYGYTVFGDNQTLVNKLGFFARNEKGNAYLVGVPNKAIMGVGLHIYGKHNDVTQANDLLASGEGAVGIRIDGSNNTLKIDPEILIAADGLNGTGLLAAYGKNHKIVTQGDIRAKG